MDTTVDTEERMEMLHTAARLAARARKNAAEAQYLLARCEEPPTVANGVAFRYALDAANRDQAAGRLILSRIRRGGA